MKAWRAWSRPAADGEARRDPPVREARNGSAGRGAEPGGNGRPATGPPSFPGEARPGAVLPTRTESGWTDSKWSLSGGCWLSIVLWSAAWATTLAAPGPDEPLALRWLRALADHPVRTATAGVMIALAWPKRGGLPSGKEPVAIGGKRS